jgi:hypothetical protein
MIDVICADNADIHCSYPFIGSLLARPYVSSQTVRITFVPNKSPAVQIHMNLHIYIYIYIYAESQLFKLVIFHRFSFLAALKRNTFNNRNKKKIIKFTAILSFPWMRQTIAPWTQIQ